MAVLIPIKAGIPVKAGISLIHSLYWGNLGIGVEPRVYSSRRRQAPASIKGARPRQTEHPVGASQPGVLVIRRSRSCRNACDRAMQHSLCCVALSALLSGPHRGSSARHAHCGPVTGGSATRPRPACAAGRALHARQPGVCVRARVIVRACVGACVRACVCGTACACMRACVRA